MTSFLKDMFDAIQQLPLDDRRRIKLTAARDQLSANLLALYTLPSRDNMVSLNGAWAVAWHTFDECQPTPPTPPRAGAGEKEVLQQKVA